MEPGLALLDGAELDPLAGVLADDEDDEDVVALCVVVVVAGLDVLPVAAMATPAALPPSPAAMTAVMMSRLTRPELVDLIGRTPSVRGRCCRRARRRAA